MNNQPPPAKKKAPPLVVTNAAREQVKQHRLARAVVMDVMRNRTGTVKFKNGLVQFTGSARYPHIYITAGFKPQTKQWVITDIQVKEDEVEPEPVSAPIAPQKPAVAAPPTVIFTNHARKVISGESLDQRAVEQVIGQPDEKQQEDDGKVRFVGQSHGETLHVIAKYLQKEDGWLVITVELRQKQDADAPPQVAPVRKKAIATLAPAPAKKKKPAVAVPPAILFTNHAKDVMSDEFLDQRVVEQVIRQPDEKLQDDDEKIRFIGQVHGDTLHVIAKYLQKENAWLVITVELRHKHDPDAPPLADLTGFDGEPTDNHPGISFTNHALERMALRDIPPNAVKDTIREPEKTFEDEDDKVKFISQALTQNRAIHVIARLLPEENRWLVISTWVRGENDDGSLSTWRPPHAKPTVGRPQIALTHNARKWMRKQGVPERHIRQAILNSRAKTKQDDGKVKFVGQRMANGKSIHVIAKFLPKEQKWLVITAWIARYQREESGIVSIIMFIVVLIVVLILGFDTIRPVFRFFGF